MPLSNPPLVTRGQMCPPHARQIPREVRAGTASVIISDHTRSLGYAGPVCEGFIEILQPFVEGQSFKYPGWAGRLHHLSVSCCLLSRGLVFSESLLRDLLRSLASAGLRLATIDAAVELDSPSSLQLCWLFGFHAAQRAAKASYAAKREPVWVRAPIGDWPLFKWVKPLNGDPLQL